MENNPYIPTRPLRTDPALLQTLQPARHTCPTPTSNTTTYIPHLRYEHAIVRSSFARDRILCAATFICEMAAFESD